MVSMDETLYAADRDRAAVVAGVTHRQLDYWTSTGLIHPAVTRRLTPKRAIRLFSFTDLMSVMVAAELRRRGVSLQHIRAVVSYLSSLGYPEPLRQLTFATQGQRVYFQHPDGGWEGDQHPGQGVMAQVIDLEPLRLRIRQEGQRSRSALGQFERRRGTLGSKPVIAGTRVPVSTVRRLLEEGHEPAEVLEAYPILGTEDVEAVAATMSA